MTRRPFATPVSTRWPLVLWLAVASCAGQQGKSDATSPDTGGQPPGEKDAAVPAAVACAPGTYDDDANDRTACRKWTDCQPGSHVTASGTAITDRSCAWCAPGFHATDINASACLTWTSCPAGQYVEKTGTGTVDQGCAPCPQGQRSISQNASSCIDVGACPAGTVQTAPATATTPPRCAACEVGTFCAGGSTASQDCAGDTWDHDGNAASTCVARTSCGPGHSVATPGSAIMDRTCAACPSGTYTGQTNAAGCSAWTDCQPGQYATLSGSAVRDRACASCPSGQYSATNNAAQCTTWQSCVAGKYVSNSPSVTADRRCSDCVAETFTTQSNQAVCLPRGACPAGTEQIGTADPTREGSCPACPPGTYCAGGGAVKQACTGDTWDDDASAATTCVPRTSCGPGQQVTGPGSAVSDRTCAPCAASSYSNGTNLGSCNLWISCGPGAYVTAGGTSISNRSCAPCASGRFVAAGQNAATCAPWTDCAPGSYVTTTPSSRANRACATCAPSTFSAQANQSMCLALGSCAAGTEQIASGTSAMPPVCVACPPGTYCAGTTTPKEPCAADTWDHDASSSTACVARTDCGAGQYVNGAGDATSDRTCTACAAASYSSGTNAGSCTGWTSCQPGLYVGTPGTATTDELCVGCASGRFSAANNAPICELWADCAASQYVTNDPSTTVDRACSDCGAGTYTAQANQSTCLPQGACAAGTEQTAAGTATMSPTCATCTAGTYCGGGSAPAQPCAGDSWDHDGTAATLCAARTTCSAGQSVTDAGSATTDRTCGDCAAGTFTALANQAICTPHDPCGVGTEQMSAGSSTMSPTCAICPAGEYCAGGSTPAGPCAADTWDHDGSAVTVCAAKATCSAGQYVTDAGSTTTERTCSDCAAGSYSGAINTGACSAWTTCQPGQYVSAAGTTTSDRACTACPAGQISTTTNASTCVPAAVCGDSMCSAPTETLANCVGDCGVWTWDPRFFSSGAEDVNGGEVNAVAVAGSDVYIGGQFTTVGNITANGLARWNGTSWSPLGNASQNGVNGVVRAMAMIGTDLYVAGDFLAVSDSTQLDRSANHIAIWSTISQTWSRLGTAGQNGTDGSIYALAVSGTDLHVGGAFDTTSSGSQLDMAASRLAVWHPLSATWSPLGSPTENGVNGQVNALVVMGTDLVVGGGFSMASDGTQPDISANNLARWNGTSWSPLGDASQNGVDGGVWALAAIGTDVYAGGEFTTVSDAAAASTPANSIARWDTTTETWSLLGDPGSNGMQDVVLALAVSGTELYVGGRFTSASDGTQSDKPANRIARWSPGSGTWSPAGNLSSRNGLNGQVNALLASGTDVLVGGQFTTASSATQVDFSFGRIALWNTTSSLWSSLADSAQKGVNGTIDAVAVNGTDVYIGGNFTKVGNVRANGIAKWNGASWSALGSSNQNGVNGRVTALTWVGDLIVGGAFTTASSSTQLNISANHIVRWNGSIWTVLGSATQNGLSGTVNAIVQRGTSFYIGGSFATASDTTQVNMSARNVVRWRTTNPNTWSPLGNAAQNGVDHTVLAVLLGADSDIYVGGIFGSASDSTQVNMAARRMARWSLAPNTPVWAPLGSAAQNGVSDRVNALASNGTDLFVGGDFNTASSTTQLNIAATKIVSWSYTGSTWSPLGAPLQNGLNDAVTTISVKGSDLYVGGAFVAANDSTQANMPANRVVRWSTTLGKWSPVSSARNGLNSLVNDLAVSGEDVFFGGYFTTAGGVPSSHFARGFIGPL